jgi:hypothetical protein
VQKEAMWRGCREECGNWQKLEGKLRMVDVLYVWTNLVSNIRRLVVQETENGKKILEKGG